LAENYKPFSIYDDDEDKKQPPLVPPEVPGENSLNLEMVDSQEGGPPENVNNQLGMAQSQTPPVEKASDSSHPSSLSNAPFLEGQHRESLENRTRDLIQQRQNAGKLRDRRKVASIFDKPIEPDKPIHQGHSRWSPFGYRAQALWFLLPSLVFFGLFYALPLYRGFQISLTHFSPLGQSVPVGWDNYTRAFNDPLFGQTMMNAAAFTALSLAFGFWPPILLAVFLNELTVGKNFLKFLYLLPFILPAVPAANLWRWIFDEGYGVLNALLQRLLGEPDLQVGWLTDPRWALLSIVLMFVWKNTGWFMMIYLASLQNMPDELYEAAEIDGAGPWHKFFSITLPYLRPVMGILLIIQVLTTFQVFTEVFVMTRGGPMHATEVIGTYIYKTAFGAMDMGYASAMAMLMFAVLFLFSMVRLLQLRQVVR
jgi:ABC-type sugar transport system permease subunit